MNRNWCVWVCVRGSWSWIRLTCRFSVSWTLASVCWAHLVLGEKLGASLRFNDDTRRSDLPTWALADAAQPYVTPGATGYFECRAVCRMEDNSLKTTHSIFRHGRYSSGRLRISWQLLFFCASVLELNTSSTLYSAKNKSRLLIILDIWILSKWENNPSAYK